MRVAAERRPAFLYRSDMRLVAVVVVLSACRWGFDPRTDAAGSASTYVAAVTADSPLAFYRFEENLADELGANPTGNAEGTLVYDSGVRGSRALRFDGATTRIVYGDAFPFAATSPFTLELWIAPEGLDDQVRRIVTRSTADNGYDVYGSESFLLASRTGEGAEGSYASVSPYPGANAQFVHVVATFDGGESALYVDGLYRGGMFDARRISSGIGTFVLGDSEPPLFFKFLGRLDELAIYDRALDASRVAAHFAAGRPP